MYNYSQNFFEGQRRGSKRSAEKILPVVIETLKPKSIVDVGCGVGTWLATSIEFGVDDIIGIDGEYINPDDLYIPRETFITKDLNAPITLNRTFDLAISMEVGEHLLPESASQFVRSLTHLAPVVLFSAAIPGQGGTHHINEQWQNYWAELFKKYGYTHIDFLRRKFWTNDAVQFWYAQNMMLYASVKYVSEHSTLPSLNETDAVLPLVHPKLYTSVHPQLMSFRQVRPKLYLNLTKKFVKKYINGYA